MRTRKTGVVVILIVLGSLLPIAVPDLARHTKVALQLSGMPDVEKRATVIGVYYRPLAVIEQHLPETASVAIVMGSSWVDRDVGVFTNYYLYPRPAMFYRGADAYQHNRYEGATQARRRPSSVVLIDHSVSPEPRLLTSRDILTVEPEGQIR